MLAVRVERGELPPVEERLPEEPRVCPVIESIGKYGGTLTVGDLSMNVAGWELCVVMGDWGSNWGRICQELRSAMPNVLKGWEISDDMTTGTYYMRKGHKWSDGTPLTTADLKFWYEDILLNTDITPLPHMGFRWGGEPMKLEIIDDYTFKITHAQPHAAWELVYLAHFYGFWGSHATWVPAHYMEQFHTKYNPDAGKLAEEAGFDFWYQLFGQRNNPNINIERPSLRAYISYRDTPAMSFHTRNPYYYAVDPDGNQLPYVEELRMDRCADDTIHQAKIVGGAYDWAAWMMNIQLYATYADAAARASAHIKLWSSGHGSEVLYNVNMNFEDDEWREVFSDRRFRQALSLAINRNEVNNVVFFENGSETQFTVIPASRHHRPEYSMAFADFDPARANALLDEMGLEWNAAKTHRLWPRSKQPMVIPFDMVDVRTRVPVTELVSEYWKDIGIEIQWKSITRTLLSQKILANEEPMSMWQGDETTDVLFLRRPKFFAPLEGDESCWGVLWGRWYNTAGEQGEEPPQEIKDLYIWLDEYNLTDSDEPARKVLESQAENVWSIGTVGNAPHPLFVRNNLRNVVETATWVWDGLYAFPWYAEQWYLE